MSKYEVNDGCEQFTGENIVNGRDLIDLHAAAQKVIEDWDDYDSEYNDWTGDEPDESSYDEDDDDAMAQYQKDHDEWKDQEPSEPVDSREEAQSIVECFDPEEINPDGTYISEDHWEDYTRDFIENVHGLDLSNWPLRCIDIEQAADELRQDYSSIDLDGVAFYTID